MSLMIIPWYPFTRGNALVLDRRLEDHAVREFVHHTTLDLLPRGLVVGDGIAPAAGERRAALFELRLGNEDVRGTCVQVDAHPVSGLEDRQTTPGGRLRGGVHDRWRS